jgi:hypothetical protein
MARGDFVLFDELAHVQAQGLINNETDTFKIGIVDATITPAFNDATPTWSDYSANEVSTAGGYPAGGLTESGPEINYAAGVATMDDDDSNFSLAQNGSGFTDGYWGIYYSDTSAAKNAVGFIDLGGPVSEQAGPININWNASGKWAMNASP